MAMVALGAGGLFLPPCTVYDCKYMLFLFLFRVGFCRNKFDYLEKLKKEALFDGILSTNLSP